MSKHTPGPWKVQQMEYGFAITDQEGYEISPTRNLSDARLIAAAPGLLQAAKDFVEWFECGRIGDMPKAELHYARDIIAKAQGGKV